jgi:hypothetical protein
MGFIHQAKPAMGHEMKGSHYNLGVVPHALLLKPLPAHGTFHPLGWELLLADKRNQTHLEIHMAAYHHSHRTSLSCRTMGAILGIFSLGSYGITSRLSNSSKNLSMKIEMQTCITDLDLDIGHRDDLLTISKRIV